MLDREGLYAAAFGCERASELRAPPVRISGPRLAGDDRQDALLFFDAGEKPSVLSTLGQTRTGDAVFVIATDPSFVLDSRREFRQRHVDVELLVRKFIAARPIATLEDRVERGCA